MMKKVYRPVTSAAFCSVTGVIVLGQWCWWTPIHVCQPIILIRWRTRLIYWHHPCCFRLFPQLQHLSEKWQVRSCCAHPQSQSKAHDDASQYQVWKQNVWWFRIYYLDRHCHFDLYCDLDLDCSNPIFHRTLWLIMLHHHIQLGSKMFCGSDDTIGTNMHWHFECLLWPWPWMQ